MHSPDLRRAARSPRGRPSRASNRDPEVALGRAAGAVAGGATGALRSEHGLGPVLGDGRSTEPRVWSCQRGGVNDVVSMAA